MLRCIDLAGDGAVLTLEGLIVGNGMYTGNVGEEMQNPLLNLGIADSQRKDECIELTAAFDNTAVTDRFRITEMGILAKNPESAENPILFAYGYVPENEAAVIPSADDYIFETEITVSVYVGTLENIEVTLEGKMTGVSKEEFDNHAKNQNNPHGVTAQDVGLGNVENKALVDQTPIYTESSSLQTASPGERLGTLLGKLARGLRDFIEHIKSSNPHKVTAEQIKAAKLEHTHSTNDVNTGILGVERGGTGVGTKDKFTELLSSYGFAMIEVYQYVGTGSYGVDNPTVIPCRFKPKLIIVGSVDDGRIYNYTIKAGDRYAYVCFGQEILTYECAVYWEEFAAGDRYVTKLVQEGWESGVGANASNFARMQMNTVGEKYQAVIIG